MCETVYEINTLKCGKISMKCLKCRLNSVFHLIMQRHRLFLVSWIFKLRHLASKWKNSWRQRKHCCYFFGFDSSEQSLWLLFKAIFYYVTLNLVAYYISFYTANSFFRFYRYDYLYYANTCLQHQEELKHTKIMQRNCMRKCTAKSSQTIVANVEL